MDVNSNTSDQRGRPANHAFNPTPIANISPEAALLCACAAWPHDQICRDRIKSCAEGEIDWSHFVALVDRHRVAALVSAAIRSSGLVLPANQATALQQMARREAMKELVLAGEAVRLVKLFKDHGVEPAILKGLSIALLGYRRLGLRTNRDIDLLVQVEELSICEKLLFDTGYERLEPAEDLPSQAMAHWLTLHKDMVYYNRQKDSIVEIHWRLFDNPHLASLEADRPFATLTYGGATIAVLPKIPNIIYLCLHGMQHAWSRMKWLADLAAMTSALSDEELFEVQKHALALGVGAPVNASLLLCSEILGLKLPTDIVKAAKSSWRAKLLKNVALHSLTTGDATEMEDQNFGSTWKNLSHYLFRFNMSYYGSEIKYDLLDDVETPAQARMLHLILRVPRWVIRQSHRDASLRRRRL